MSDRIHELKTWPEFFDPIRLGLKLVELRKDDRGFNHGDTLKLREWHPVKHEYTGRVLLVSVTHIVRGHASLVPGYVAMSIEVVGQDDECVCLHGARAAVGDSCMRCGRKGTRE